MPIRIEVESDSVDVYFNDQLILTRAVSPTAGQVGISAGTGAYACEFSMRDIVISER